MTLYALPSGLTPSKTAWRWMDDQIALQSMFGGSVQRVDFNGGLYAVDMSFERLSGEEKRLLRNWLFKIGRVGNWAQVIDHSYERAGAGGGSLLVNGASQDGLTLVMDGATPSVTGILLAGDRLGLANGRVVEVAEDVNSDISGNVTIATVYPIQDAPADDSAIEIDAPAIICRLADPSFGYDNSPPVLSGFTFTLIQDITTGVPAPVYS